MLQIMLKRLSILALSSAILSTFASADLSTNEAYQNGVRALANHLPAQAAVRFQKALKDKGLPVEEVIQIKFKLCEAQIRSRQWTQATETLEDESLKLHPDYDFWLGQALFTTNRPEAIVAFTKAGENERSNYRGIALLALSEIYNSLNQPKQAFEALRKAADVTSISDSANLQMAEIFLNQQDLERAEHIVDKLKPSKQIDQNTHLYLKAKLLLKQEKYAEAIEAFQELMKKEGLVSRLLLGSELGIAEGFASIGRTEEACKKVLDLIEKEPDSPELYNLFARLTVWLPKLEEKEFLLGKLEEWIREPEKVLVEGESVALEYPDLNAFSHYLLAMVLGGSNERVDRMRALKLLGDLREKHPLHILKTKSLLLASSIHLAGDEFESAISILEKVIESARTNEEKAKARFLIAQIHVDNRDVDKALRAFQEVVDLGDLSLSEEAKVNIALLQLREGNIIAFQETADAVSDEMVKQGLLLDRAMNDLDSEEGRIRLEKLISEHAEHGASIEARIALAQDYLRKTPVELKKAEKVIQFLSQSERLSKRQRNVVQQLQARLLVYSKDWEAVIAQLEKELGNSVDAQLLVALGEAYFRNGEFNKSRKTFNKVIQLGEETVFTEFSYYFSALAALKEGTPQSKIEAEQILLTVMKRKGSFYHEALIQWARLRLDNGDYTNVRERLETVIQAERLADSVKLNISILLSDAYHRQAVDTRQPDGFNKAIEIYNTLLANHKLSAEWYNRIQFLKGQTQEKIDPTNAAAIDTYFKVVNLEWQQDKSAPKEWRWYYKAGLRVVDLLEKEERWQAAVSILEQMVETEGPKTDILKERADKLRLAHQLWD